MPLLLLACAFPSLAAQTWTTVWTPGGAPALKSGARSTDDHESDPDHSNECHPCKEWENYEDRKGGRWIKYDKGTPPTVCPGDTTDYACKECDGSGEVRDKDDGTDCNAGQGCGCCKNGKCWAPEPDCKRPMEITFEFTYIGPCLCNNGELGCMEPVLPPVSLIDFSACYDSCAWNPVPPVLTIGYREGLCPERCDDVINSAADVDADNYCAVLDKLDERIAKGEEWSVNPPSGSTSDPPPPPEAYCFDTCYSRHEAVHLEQLRCMWEDMKSDMLGAISGTSIPFECNTADTPEKAIQAMEDQLRVEMQSIQDLFWARWYDSETIADQEREAHQDTLDCLSDLLEQIQNKAQELNWPGCGPT